MSTHTPRLEPVEGSLAAYVTGFVLSLLLTGTAYLMVTRQVLAGSSLVLFISALALIQLIVQLVFFLHLDLLRSRWKLYVFLFMFLVVMILVGGTLWIMHNLQYRMAPGEVGAYMNSQDGF